MEADDIQDGPGRRQRGKEAVQSSGCKPSWLLPFSQVWRSQGGRDGVTRRDTEDSDPDAELWVSSNHG